MSHEADQELLSAYLDGELTADEQARVERLLADNPAYRQLYDELRALRTNFEILPRYALPKDLSSQVLRRAEQALLHGTGSPVAADGSKTASGRPAGSSNGSSTPGTRPRQELGNGSPAGEQGGPGDAGDEDVPVVRLRWPRGWRPWLWPAVAAAAALYVAIFSPERAPRKIARIERDPADIAIGAPAPKQPAERLDAQPQAERQLAEPQAAERGLNKREAEAVAKKAADQAVADQMPAEEKAPLERGKQAFQQQAPAANAGRALGRAETKEERSGFGGQPAAAAREAARSEPMDAVSAAPKLAADASDKAADRAAATRKAADAKAAVAKGTSAGDTATGAPALNTPAAGSAPANAPAAEPPAEQVAAGHVAAGTASALRARVAQGDGAVPGPEGVLVVDCEVRPEAAGEGVFDALLAKYKISLEGAGGSMLAGAAAQQRDGDQANAAAEPAAPAVLAAGLAPDEQAARKPVAPAGSVTPLYIEASWGQIRMLLADISRRKDDFPVVHVMPAAGARSQQPFLAFNRPASAAGVAGPIATAQQQQVAAGGKGGAAQNAVMASPQAAGPPAAATAPQIAVPGVVVTNEPATGAAAPVAPKPGESTAGAAAAKAGGKGTGSPPVAAAAPNAVAGAAAPTASAAGEQRRGISIQWNLTPAQSNRAAPTLSATNEPGAIVGHQPGPAPGVIHFQGAGRLVSAPQSVRALFVLRLSPATRSPAQPAAAAPAAAQAAPPAASESPPPAKAEATDKPAPESPRADQSGADKAAPDKTPDKTPDKSD